MSDTSSIIIDAFCHILPPKYKDELYKKAKPCYNLEANMARPALFDLDARFRVMDKFEGLQQVLTIFTYSRVPISALTIGTAVGAFEMAVAHAEKRHIFGKRLIDFQAKAFETADLYARIEAARLMLLKACWAVDRGEAFRLESSTL